MTFFPESTVRSHELSNLLGEALSSPDAARAVRRLLHAQIASEPAFVQEESRDLSVRLAERLDAIGDSDERLLEASRAAQRLLSAASSAGSVEQLLELVMQSPRLHQVLGRHLEGRLSRTQFLSFVAEQSWTRTIRTSVAELRKEGLEQLRDATHVVDIATLERLLLRAPERGVP